MQNNIYGTFAADSVKEYVQNNVEGETVSIWNFLNSATTMNSNYIKNNGVIHFSSESDRCRVWKEYFVSLILKKQDHYKYEDEAEDNEDYPNLMTRRVTQENQQLRDDIKSKLKKINNLKQKLQSLDNPIAQTW